MMKKKIKVIITDDDPVIILMHKKAVVKGGLTTDPLTFSNAIETLHFLKANYASNTHYLILLDINMPEMSGWQLLDRITEMGNSGIRVIVVSSSVNITDFRKAESHPLVISYIEKPLTIGKIQELVNNDLFKAAFTT